MHAIATRADIEDRAAHLLPPSPAFARLVSLVVDERASLADVEAVVRTDPSLSVHVISVANSAAYSRGTAVVAVDRAVALLGLDELLRIALAASSSFLGGDLDGYGVHGGRGLHKAVCTAFLAEEIARRNGACDTGLLFAGGLLADIGRLVLDDLVAGADDQISAAVGEPHGAFTEVEHDLLGLDHAEAGAAIARSWTLPPELVDLIAHHHTPGAAVNPRCAAVVHVADVLATSVLPCELGGLEYPADRAALEAVMPADCSADALAVDAYVRSLELLETLS